MNVSVVIPTRGNVDLQPIVDSFPAEWEIVVWDNGRGKVHRIEPNRRQHWWAYDCAAEGVADLAVYARYAAIEHCTHDLILTQDDDVIVSDPQAIVDAWTRIEVEGTGEGTMESPWYAREDHVVCNMPQEFRPHYPDSALVGFGAAFHRDTPARAFEKFRRGTECTCYHGNAIDPGCWACNGWHESDLFQDTCDVVFTALTPRVLVDVPKENLPYATGDDRMYRQASHVGERTRMLELARKVRDA